MIPYTHNSRKCNNMQNDKRFISHGLSTSAKGFVHVHTCTWITCLCDDESIMHLDYTDKFSNWSTQINMLCTVKGADSCTKVMHDRTDLKVAMLESNSYLSWWKVALLVQT